MLCRLKPKTIAKFKNDASRNMNESSSTASPDSLLLEWGSSVNMNEDLRRAIRAECDEIDVTLSSLHDQIQMEERKQNQVQKDLHHAKVELLNLVKSGRDLVDGSMMNEQIQANLRETILMEIVAIVTPPTSPGTLVGEEDPLNCCDNEVGSSRKASAQCTNPSPSEIGMGRYIVNLRTEMKKMTESIRATKKELVDTKNSNSFVRQEIKTLSGPIAQNQKIQASLAQDVEVKRKELEMEKQRFRSIKESLANTRKRCGDFAQQVVDEVSVRTFTFRTPTVITKVFFFLIFSTPFKSKKLALTKAQQSEEESRFQLELDSLKVKETKVKETFVAKQKESAEITGKLESLQEQLREYKDLKQKQASLEQATKEVEEENKLLCVEKQQLLKIQQELKEDLDSSQMELDKAKEEQLRVEALVQDNDRREKEEIKPSQIELENILKESETIAKAISDLHEEEDSRQKNLQQNRKRNEEKLQEIFKEIVSKRDVCEEREKEISKLEEAISKNRDSTRKEIEEIEKMKTSFDSDIEAQQKKNQEEKYRLEKMQNENNNAELDNEIKESQFQLEVYKRGEELIKLTEDIECQLSELRGNADNEKLASIKELVNMHFTD